MEPLSFLLAGELTRNATLGSHAADPTVPVEEEHRPRLPAIALPSLGLARFRRASAYHRDGRARLARGLSRSRGVRVGRGGFVEECAGSAVPD
jgi:hypothetical protein